MSLERDIFRQGSTTYYWSSVFFPRRVRDDVFRLYSFVRIVDNLVDTQPQDAVSFERVERAWHKQAVPAEGVSPIVASVLANMFDLQERYDWPKQWTDAFLASMRWDLEGRHYDTIEQSLEYVYGSAEVIGLMMSSILALPQEAAEGACMQGRAMQWINFCRDIQEDVELGRCYFPAEDLARYGLSDLQEATVRASPEQFKLFMRSQLDMYDVWQRKATEAHRYIPRRMRIPVQTAANMYNWTAAQIREDPFIVYARKVKPRPRQVMRAALWGIVRA